MPEKICNLWQSAHVWIENGRLLTQQCKKCEAPCTPFKVKKKDWSGESISEKPHDEVKKKKVAIILDV